MDLMFEVCACLGTRSQELRRFGHLLGVLYHGCDDVGDVRGAAALGGGEEDLRGILTLPAALAIRDPDTARLFCAPQPSAIDLKTLAATFAARPPDAERHLDGIAEQPRGEARAAAANPEPLLALVERTRQLSAR
jgi:hypothetical protein